MRQQKFSTFGGTYSASIGTSEVNGFHFRPYKARSC